jgi:hypothetical protein
MYRERPLLGSQHIEAAFAELAGVFGRDSGQHARGRLGAGEIDCRDAFLRY